MEHHSGRRDQFGHQLLWRCFGLCTHGRARHTCQPRTCDLHQLHHITIATIIRGASLQNSLRQMLCASVSVVASPIRRIAFLGVINSATDAIITIDGEQRITLFNPAAERMFRCSLVEVLGTPLDRLIPAGLHEAHRSHIRDFGAMGVTNRSMVRPGIINGLRTNGE